MRLGPLLPQLGAVLAQVRHQLRQQLVLVLPVRASGSPPTTSWPRCASSFMRHPSSPPLGHGHGGAAARARRRRRTRPSAGGRPADPGPGRGRCCSRRCRACSTSAMPGPVSRATTRKPRPRLLERARRRPRPTPANRTMLRAISDTAVAITVRSVPREAQPRRPARGPPAGPATMSASAWIGMRTSSSRCWPRSSSGSLSRAQRSHSSRCRAASTSRCRRRSPLDSASSTGRQRSVGGSTPLAAPAGTRPAAGPGSGSAARRRRRRSTRARAASDLVSCPATSCASSVSPLALGQPGQRLARRPSRSSSASRSSSGASARPQVDDPVLVAPVPVLLLPHRSDQVAGRDDRVRLEHARLDPARPRPAPGPASPARGRRRRPGRPPAPRRCAGPSGSARRRRPARHRCPGSVAAPRPAARHSRSVITPHPASCTPRCGVFRG